MAKQDRHLTTARLSAFIDGQLSVLEQAQTEDHLRTCELCQTQLAELRQTVALLHALLQPKVPRSFTLPMPEAALAPRSAEHRLHPVPDRRSRPKRGMPTYIRGTIRVVSTLAAVVGIVFLLSGLLGTVIVLPIGGSSTASSGTTTSASSQHNAITPHIVTPSSTNTSGQDVTPSSTNTPSLTGHRAKNDNPTQQNQPSPLLAFFDLRMPVSRAIIGLILAVLAIIGFVTLGRRA